MKQNRITFALTFPSLVLVSHSGGQWAARFPFLPVSRPTAHALGKRQRPKGADHEDCTAMAQQGFANTRKVFREYG